MRGMRGERAVGGNLVHARDASLGERYIHVQAYKRPILAELARRAKQFTAMSVDGQHRIASRHVPLDLLGRCAGNGRHGREERGEHGAHGGSASVSARVFSSLDLYLLRLIG